MITTAPHIFGPKRLTSVTLAYNGSLTDSDVHHRPCAKYTRSDDGSLAIEWLFKPDDPFSVEILEKQSVKTLEELFDSFNGGPPYLSTILWDATWEPTA